MKKVRILLTTIFIIIGFPLLLILAIVVPYNIHHYYQVRMIVPIEWVGVTEENYGKNISAEFLEMEHSYAHYSIKRKFKIGKTKNLILPHSLFIFDPDSVKPENIQLKLDNPEFVFEINHDEYPLDYSHCKITFMVSEK